MVDENCKVFPATAICACSYYTQKRILTLKIIPLLANKGHLDPYEYFPGKTNK